MTIRAQLIHPATQESLDALAGMVKNQPTQGKLEALTDLRDRIPKNFEPFAKRPEKIFGWLGLGLMATTMLTAFSWINSMIATNDMSKIIDPPPALMKEIAVSTEAAEFGLGGMALLTAGLVASGRRLGQFSRAENALGSMIALEAKRTIAARPGIEAGLSPFYDRRLKYIFDKATPYSPDYDAALQAKIAQKRDILTFRVVP